MRPALVYALFLCAIHMKMGSGVNNDLGGGHEIVSLVVPLLADPRDNATLSCRYTMGSEQLYSAKWFKDDHEIFRFMPTQEPPGLSFNVRGVNLAVKPSCSYTSCDLILTALSSQSQGTYRCEVSTEGPTFRIAHRSGNMTIAALPRKDPRLEGLVGQYSLGDEIRVNCTSDVSLPPPQLTFYVNEKEASFLNVEGPWEVSRDLLGLSSRSLSLKLLASKSLFSNSLLRIRCAALLPSSVPGGPHLRQTQMNAQLGPSAHLEKLTTRGGSSAASPELFTILLVLCVKTILTLYH